MKWFSRRTGLVIVPNFSSHCAFQTCWCLPLVVNLTITTIQLYYGCSKTICISCCADQLKNEDYCQRFRIFSALLFFNICMLIAREACCIGFIFMSPRGRDHIPSEIKTLNLCTSQPWHVNVLAVHNLFFFIGKAQVPFFPFQFNFSGKGRALPFFLCQQTIAV